MFENTKVVISSRKSKTDRQYNGKNKTDQRRSNDLQNMTQKTKDRATRTPLTTGVELRCSWRVSISCFTCGTRCATIASKPVVSHW